MQAVRDVEEKEKAMIKHSTVVDVLYNILIFDWFFFTIHPII